MNDTLTAQQRRLLDELDQALTLARLAAAELKDTLPATLLYANVCLIHDQVVPLAALARASRGDMYADRPDLSVDWCAGCGRQTSHRDNECVVCGVRLPRLLLVEGGAS